MDILKLTQEKLSVGDINDQVALESCGAISIFIGTTRDNFDGKKVARLEYESYETMAIKALKNICSEIRSKWVSVGNIAIYHRLGCVPVKEASVVIAISSPHRAESLEAVSFCIEKLKGNVPIWKKEIYDGELEKESVWKENKECSWSRPQDNNEPILIQPSEISHNNKELVQLNVSFEELQWRINNFIERKRDQVNINNRHDFIQSDGTVDTLEDGKGLAEDTCARVRTLFLKRGDSKGHLKVHRAYNQWGPQTVRPESQTKNGSKNDNQRAEYRSTNPALEERFSNIEDYLNISKSPVPSDIYKRLKIMEDRIAHLETISPEYSVFWDHNRSENFKETHDGPEAKVKCLFTARDIDKKIKEMENQTSF